MSDQNELKEAYEKYGKGIKALYEKYRDVKPTGLLDGEPWADEERVLKSALLVELQEIKRKHKGA